MEVLGEDFREPGDGFVGEVEGAVFGSFKNIAYSKFICFIHALCQHKQIQQNQ
jgi:hypothetical protein